MKKAIPLLVGTMIVALIVVGCGNTATQGAPVEKEPIPDFTLKSVEGKDVTLSDHLKKKVVLLDFGATWCPPCGRAVPKLTKLHTTYGEKMKLIAVYIDAEEQTIKDYVKGHKIPYTMLMNTTGSVAQKYKVRGIPTLIVIDLEGTVRYRGHDAGAAGEMVEKLLKKD